MRFTTLSSVISLLLAVGCGSSTNSDTGSDDSDGPTGEASLTEPGTAPLADVLGRCTYTNPFSQNAECKEYRGEGWTEVDATANCDAPVPGGSAGLFEAGIVCERLDYVGECIVDDGEPTETITVFPGSDPSSCGGAELGCTFSQGVFIPSDVCSGEPESEGVATENAFVPFQQVCVDPLPGEPAGEGPDGQVCTWESVSGATEEGRRFVDYASCDPIFSQRPYVPYETTVDTSLDDARLSDTEWAEEFAWVTGQFESTSCSCCHAATYAPNGASGWDLEDEPIWLDGVDDDGLAMLAGWVDSTAFGAFDPADNNGFDRSVTGVPTTDIPRMVAFLEGELQRRGFEEQDFVATAPFGGVLYDQLFYVPEACPEDVGLMADGTLAWTGGPARYLYVLDKGSDSPGVPPNLDLPDGTVWRLDVDYSADPVRSGVTYGEAPAGAQVTFPASGQAPELVRGQTYYLVALLDIYQPATRCEFVAP